MGDTRWYPAGATVPRTVLARLLTGVFFTFSAIGFLEDIFMLGGLTADALFRAVVFSGAIAATWAFVFTRPKRQLLGLLPLLIVGQIAFTKVVRFHQRDSALVPPNELKRRMELDAIGSGASLIIGFACLMHFLRAVGDRYARIQAEIRFAHDIHALLVPTIARTNDRFEFFGLSSPSGEVGGDLIDLVERDGGWTAYIADVSGHGVASGVLMSMVKSAARMKLATRVPLEALLSDLNRVILPLKTPNMFVTCACLQFDGSESLSFSVAGHLPILRLGSSAPEIAELTVPQVALGFFNNQTFAASRVEFRPGDLFLLVTDGLTEVFDERGEEFGMDALKEAIQGASNKPLSELVANLLTQIRQHGKQLDDQTILAIRCLDWETRGSGSIGGEPGKRVNGSGQVRADRR
jgi:hypothetical protein